jgi:hypothetical protein
MKLGL